MRGRGHGAGLGLGLGLGLALANPNPIPNPNPNPNRAQDAGARSHTQPSPSPEPSPKLKRAIDAYARRVGFEYGGIFEIDGSKRSAHSNAFFTGFGATKRVALFDTLVAQVRVS